MTRTTEHFDTIIIGGGPAGMSAALWCADLGLQAVLLEREPELGGQLLWTFNAITNYLGVEAKNGRELCDRFLQHLEGKRVNLLSNSSVKTADLKRRSVELEDGRAFGGRSVIIATGVRRRKLNIPGEDEFRGRGMLESGVRDRSEVAGKHVVIVGGGDAALENALVLSETAARVVLVHRRGEFSARPEFVAAVRGRDNIELLLESRLTAIKGKTSVEAAEIRNSRTGEVSTVAADALLVRIGVVPNSEVFRGQIELTSGYIVTTKNGETSRPGIYAVGDVAHSNALTISSAVGSAATAVKSLISRFEHS